MERIFENHSAIADFSQVFLAVLALVATIAAFKQLKTARETQTEATAAETHRAYIQLAIEYPLFANPKLMLRGEPDSLIDFKNETIGGNREKFEQYEWFISLMMLSFRDLWHKSDDHIIKSLMLLNVKYHEDYFAHYENEWKNRGAKRYLAMYGEDISRVISDIARGAGVAAAGSRNLEAPNEVGHT